MTTFLVDDFRKLLDRLEQVERSNIDDSIEIKPEIKTGNQKLTETKKKI